MVIDLTREDAIVEVTSQDISSSTSQDISIGTSQDSHTDRKLSTGARRTHCTGETPPVPGRDTDASFNPTDHDVELPSKPTTRVVPTCPRQGTTLKNYTSIQQNESTMIMTKIQK